MEEKKGPLKEAFATDEVTISFYFFLLFDEKRFEELSRVTKPSNPLCE